MAATANPRARLDHILFHIQGVADTINGISFETFTSVYHMERTVERAVQIISEAVRTLPREIMARYPEVEWPKIAGIGNILRHEYERVDPMIMWDIATITSTRLEALSDIPTVSDFVPGYEASQWYAIALRKSTPAEIIEKLNKEINAILADPKMKARLADLGTTPLVGSSADFEKFVANDTARWAKVIKFEGIQPG
jgi:uncharacterized protein with HEPN domain